MVKMVKKENKFFALIIPTKDMNEFFGDGRLDKKLMLDNLNQEYAKYRISTGRKPYNKYIICNQDEPYAEKVWQTILEGEKNKR